MKNKNAMRGRNDNKNVMRQGIKRKVVLMCKKMTTKNSALAMGYFLLTFLGDKLIFDFQNLNVFNYVTIKIILLGILLWAFNYLRKVNFLKTKYFLVMFLILLGYFVILYPGTWLGSDVYLIYDKAVTCDYFYHLNYLTTLFYIVSMMLVPVPFAPILLQILLAAMTFAYVADKTRRTFGLKSGITWAFVTPFVLPHAIFYTMYPNRPILFGFLMLILLVTLLCDTRKRARLTKRKALMLIVLTAFLGVIRTEAVYLIVAVPVLGFFIYRRSLNRQKMMLYGVGFVALFLGLMVPQKSYEFLVQTKYERQTRNLPSYISPLSLMLVNNSFAVSDDELKTIDKVLNVKDLKKYSSYYDVNCLWQSEECVRKFDDQELADFKRTFLKLIWRNKRLFLEAKYKVFWEAASVENGDHFTTAEIFEDGNEYILNSEMMRPLSRGIRRMTYRFLEGRTGNNFIDAIYKGWNNLLIPLLAILLVTVYFGLKKSWLNLGLNLTVLIGVGIIFIAAPAAYFMYYYFAYLYGWYLITLFVANRVSYRRFR